MVKLAKPICKKVATMRGRLQFFSSILKLVHQLLLYEQTFKFSLEAENNSNFVIWIKPALFITEARENCIKLCVKLAWLLTNSIFRDIVLGNQWNVTLNYVCLHYLFLSAVDWHSRFTAILQTQLNLGSIFVFFPASQFLLSNLSDF